MIVLFDNILAGIVGAIAALILVTSFLRVQSVNVDTTAAYASRQLGSDVATWVEQDLLSMGQNMAGNTMPITSVVDSAGFTKQFSFLRNRIVSSVDDEATLAPVETRYTLAYAGTREGGSSGDYNLYQLVREVRFDGGAWVRDGGTPPILRSFAVELLNGDMKAMANPSAVITGAPQTIRNVGIRFSLAPLYRSSYATLQSTQHASTLTFSYENGALVNLNK
jgi:hypothetical protein